MGKIKYVIGIDPGKNTGIAIKDIGKDKLIFMKTMMIHEAFDIVLKHIKESYILVEDAHLWNDKSAKNYNARAQGAGSIKRDCTIWKDFLKDHAAFFDMPRPMTKKVKDIKHKEFIAMTGWDGRTNEHNRVAGMMVWGYNEILVKALHIRHKTDSK
jgi:hypothetical protein